MQFNTTSLALAALFLGGFGEGTLLQAEEVLCHLFVGQACHQSLVGKRRHCSMLAATSL